MGSPLRATTTTTLLLPALADAAGGPLHRDAGDGIGSNHPRLFRAPASLASGAPSSRIHLPRLAVAEDADPFAHPLFQIRLALIGPRLDRV